LSGWCNSTRRRMTPTNARRHCFSFAFLSS
jgi:hypothetical protein